MDHNLIDVLLVDDNANDAELALRELKKYHFPYKLFHVRDGEDALNFIFAEGKFEKIRMIDYPPKVILLDIHMPKITGIEVLEKLKADKRTKKIPVVMLTSSNQKSDIKKCYSLGANSYIVKSLDFEKFSLAIKHLSAYWLSSNQPPA